MSDIAEKIAQPVMDIVKDIASKVPKALEAAHEKFAVKIHEAADAFDKTEEELANRAGNSRHIPGESKEETPLYVVDHDGNVKKLMPDGKLDDIPAHDNS